VNDTKLLIGMPVRLPDLAQVSTNSLPSMPMCAGYHVNLILIPEYIALTIFNNNSIRVGFGFDLMK